MTHFEKLIAGLVKEEIEFVIIGGIAAVTHGSAYETRDLDICYVRSQENLKKLIHLLKKLNAKLRGAPPDVPFLLDAKTITMGMNFTFTTTFGELDLLGEVDGLGQYQEVSRYAEPYDLFGHKVLVLSLDGLIKTKRAAGRPKDQLHLKELEAIRAMKRGA